MGIFPISHHSVWIQSTKVKRQFLITTLPLAPQLFIRGVSLEFVTTYSSRVDLIERQRENNNVSDPAPHAS